MLEKLLKIDGKDYMIRSTDWDGDILTEAAAKLEEGILYYKQTKDELSAVVLAALFFAYDSVANSKNPQKSIDLTEYEDKIGKVLQKIQTHLQTPKSTD